VGCGLRDTVEVGRRPVRLWLNIITPYMPITSDGKEPDLLPFLNEIRTASEKAIGRAKRQVQGDSDKVPSQKDVIYHVLTHAIEKASGGAKYRYSLRQLYYVVRPFAMQYTGRELDYYGYFSKVITECENVRGKDLPMLYRDDRGSLYHPHTGQSYSLGTLTVEGYKRPAWTFNKVLYCAL
jgi:hypothetical protein